MQKMQHDIAEIPQNARFLRGFTAISPTSYVR